MSSGFTKLIYWAGSKFWMQDQLLDCLPSEYGDIYVGFAGRLDLLQILRAQGVEKHVYASDISPRLMMAHKGIKQSPEEVIGVLEEHQANASADYYVSIRNRFDLKMPLAMAAADFIYLSRNSYKGIIKIAANGRCTNISARDSFNFSPKDVHRHSRFLRNTTIVAEDYAATAMRAKAGDLVLLDPPYPGALVHGCMKFTDGDHYRLRHVCNELQRKGVLFLLTNGDTPFVRYIYRDFCIGELEAPRTLGWTKNGGRVTELLITNY